MERRAELADTSRGIMRFFVAAIALLPAADRTGMVKWLLAAAVFLAGCIDAAYGVQSGLER